MNPKSEFKNRLSGQFKKHLAARAAVQLLCPAALVLALTGPARAETPPAAIPLSDIGAKATADYQGNALAITATSDGVRLRCGFQKLEAEVTPEGLWLESTAPGAAGKLRLVARSVGRAEIESEVGPARRAGRGEGALGESVQPAAVSARPPYLPPHGTVSVEDKLVRFTRPGVTEEYSVSVDGVRQDFVIAARPAGAGDLRVELALSGARAEAAAYGARLKLDGSGREVAYKPSAGGGCHGPGTGGAIGSARGRPADRERS
jgi:hypothetical protein